MLSFQKGDAFKKLKERKKMAENLCEIRVEALRTDNRREYASPKFENSRHEYTVQKVLEQNDISERLNRTLMENVQHMLLDLEMLKMFWATYPHNWSPSKPLNGITPLEASTDLTPIARHLRGFGSAAYAHIPKDGRSKLDPS